ncbi:MAG: hypothetical protein QGI05_02550 [Candidatus Omnitrophota bacterium]|jgi:hypothetical protein|nr:hypothetical protein [Candidatus Omnitrophota bacterium]
MFKSIKEKLILKQALIVIGVMAVIYFIVLSPFLKEGSSILDEELDRKTIELKRYIARTGSMPSKTSFDKLEDNKDDLEKKLKGLVDFVDPLKVRIGEATTEAGLYFIEKLHSSTKTFQDRVASKDVTLPENLGFGDGLPKKSMVNALLRQLEVVEIVLEEALDKDNIEISAIKPLRSIEYIEPLSKELFYTELAVQISMKTDSDAFVELLMELKNAIPVVAVKELHIKSSSAENEEIEASLVLSSFRIERNKK